MKFLLICLKILKYVNKKRKEFKKKNGKVAHQKLKKAENPGNLGKIILGKSKTRI